MHDTPVILVHGFLASPNLLRPMKHRLEKRGHTVYLANLSPLCIQDIRRLARELYRESARCPCGRALGGSGGCHACDAA